MKKILLGLFLISLFGFSMYAQNPKELTLNLEEDEMVWAGVIWDGHLMPFTKDYKMDFYGNNKGNQLSPLILTSKGQFVWSEEPYEFVYDEDKISIRDPYGMVVTGKPGNTLPEVQRYVTKEFFPPSGLMPDTLLFAAPQYNTWIELTYYQNQEGILEYARKFLDLGFPPGVLMIDDTWQEDYGLWKFHPGRFPDPKAMMDELHEMGFKVMLWVVPFVSPDQTLLYKELKRRKAFLLEKENPDDTWETAKEPIMIRWWNGVSAELDFSNPEAVEWFNSELDRMVNEYGADGFKLDAGDMRFYPPNALSKEDITPNEHCRLYTQFGLRFPLNEYRACWKMANQPLAQRLHDKAHNWEDVHKLIPQMVVEGLMGYTFSCPDMIGGGLWTTFLDESKIDQELVVRSAQCHALMPMMQFSVAPWRILSEENMQAVKKAVDIRMEHTPLIMRLAKESALTGEPILKNMEFVFPGQGYELIDDQFMLGDNLLVAPVLEKGATKRSVVLPKGTWLADDGSKYRGGRTIEVEAPIDRLPYFEKVK